MAADRKVAAECELWRTGINPGAHAPLVRIAPCPPSRSFSPNYPLTSPAIAGPAHRYLVPATLFDRRATAHLALRQLATFAEIGLTEAATTKDAMGAA